MGEMQQEQEAEPQPATGPQLPMEFSARPPPFGGLLSVYVPVVLVAGLLTIIVAGLFGLVVFLFLTGSAVCLFIVGILATSWNYVRVDREGITLATWRPGAHRLPPLRQVFIPWKEIARVRGAHWIRAANGDGMILELQRSGRWASRLRPRPMKGIPVTLSGDARLADALRAHLSPEKIAPPPERFDGEAVPSPALLCVIYVLLAAMMAWVAWKASRGEYGEPWVAVSLTALWIASFTHLLNVRREHGASGALIGAFRGLPAIAPLASVAAMILGHYALVPAIAWGAASVFVLFAVFALVGSGLSAWLRAAALGSAFCLGAVVGWHTSDGAGERFVCDGTIVDKAWTPDGRDFLVNKNPHAALWTLHSHTEMQWFSRDLRPGPSIRVPYVRSTLAVGQKGALVNGITPEGEQRRWTLWFVPRSGAPATPVVSGERTGLSCVSPGRAWAIVYRRPKDTPEELVFEFASQQLRPLLLPPLTPTPKAVGISDLGEVYFLSGAAPRDHVGEPVSYGAPVPQDGVYPHPGTPYSIWESGPNGSEPFRKVYEATTPWLEWRTSRDGLRLDVRRVSDSRPAHAEQVWIDFSSVPPKTIPQILQGHAAFDRCRSEHYELLTFFSGRRVPTIVDLATGRPKLLNMPACMVCAYVSRDAWSPDGRFLLIPGTTLRPDFSFWGWTHRSSDIDRTFTRAVYLVDCDRAFAEK